MATHIDKELSANNQHQENINMKEHGSAAFQAQYFFRDTAAGLITGAMAIPLSIGIAIMSDYPIKVGLATVAFASLIGWLFAWFRPGNYIGSPGIAAGLAPVLALGVASFGWENMAFCIFLTAIMQAIIWKINDPVARPRGIRKAQVDAALLLVCLDSLHTAQPNPNPLFPLQLQHNSHPSKTHRPTGLVSNPASS